MTKNNTTSSNVEGFDIYGHEELTEEFFITSF